MKILVLLLCAFASASALEENCLLEPLAGQVVLRNHNRLSGLQLYTYDADSNKCYPFYYGGNDGIGNQFQSLADCEKTCKQEDPCKQKPFSDSIKAGPIGSMRSVLWTYIAAINKCARYEAGRNVNDNVFETAQECANTCKKDQCADAPFSGIGYPNSYKDEKAWSYVAGSNTCVKYAYSGFGANSNSFKTLTECQQKCL